MSEQQILAKLHDIQLPTPIGWWPLAPGWYFLFVVSLSLFGLLFFLRRRALANAKAKKQALQLLAHYEQDYHQTKNSSFYAMKISELLRRVALVYFSREEVASLEGEAWLHFLAKTSKNIDFNALYDHLLIIPYQSATKSIDLTPLFRGASAWIKQRGTPCST